MKISHCLLCFAFAIAAMANAQSGTVTLTNLRLVDTTLQIADAFQQISAFCSQEGCTASTPVVQPINIRCPGRAGRTCTFKVRVNVSGLVATSNSIAAFQFVGDGTETNPIPGAAFVFIWQGTNDGPLSARITSTSATFVVLAKNETSNQQHHVEVDLICREAITGQGGCTTGTFPNILNAGDEPGTPATVETQVFVSSDDADKGSGYR
jgi:hypothetical protein